jgi:hypothetical protein
LSILEGAFETMVKKRPRLILLAVGAAAAACLVGPAIASAVVPSKLFGVIPQTPTLSALDVQRVSSLRASSMRMLMVPGYIQSRPGLCSPATVNFDTCDWSQVDNMIGSSAAAGAKPMPFVIGSLPSQTGDLFRPPLATEGQKTTWKSFLSAAVARYGPNGIYWRTLYPSQFPGKAAKPVRIWQIWNEPGSPAYYQPKPAPRSYAKLLKISRQALRSADPKAKLMIAGLFASTDRGAIRGRIPAIQFLKRLYKVRGVKKTFDIVGLHPYSRTVKGALGQARGIRKVMRENGDRRTQLSISELGWSSNRPNGSLLAKGPKGQTRMLRNAFRALIRARRALRLHSVMWFSLRDIDPAGPGSCPNCPYSGLVKLNGKPKPSFRAFRSFTRRR